jgi:short-subunit dehydrogenase
MSQIKSNATSNANVTTASKKVILVTGASGGFGRLTAEALAQAGHTVYASMRDVTGRNAKNTAEMAETSKRDNVDLRALELDVQSELSANGRRRDNHHREWPHRRAGSQCRTHDVWTCGIVHA